jgi:type II secretory pathway pseudopilin PulG
MSNQSSGTKNWLFFALGAGATILISAIGLVIFSKSGQSPSAGTWKIEPSAAGGSPSVAVTLVISKEGNITALSPLNEKEAIVVGKISKVSDVTTLPENAKVEANPFANQANKARQSEAKTYVGSMNITQQAYYLEKGKWAKTIDESGVGIKSESENYRYNIQIDTSIKTTNIKNYQGVTIQTAISKKPELKNYLGVVYLSGTTSNDITSLAILCESNEPTTNAAGSPKFDGKEMKCPDGYTAIN